MPVSRCLAGLFLDRFCSSLAVCSFNRSTFGRELGGRPSLGSRFGLWFSLGFGPLPSEFCALKLHNLFNAKIAFDAGKFVRCQIFFGPDCPLRHVGKNAGFDQASTCFAHAAAEFLGICQCTGARHPSKEGNTKTETQSNSGDGTGPSASRIIYERHAHRCLTVLLKCQALWKCDLHVGAKPVSAKLSACCHRVRDRTLRHPGMH